MDSGVLEEEKKVHNIKNNSYQENDVRPDISHDHSMLIKYVLS